MNFTELKQYFEGFATYHTLIRHAKNEKHFFFDHEDAINNLRDSMNCPAVIMGPPEFTPYERHRDNQQEVTGTTLIIVDKVTRENQAEKEAAYDKCKTIAVDFIRRLIRDEQNQQTIIAFEPENCTIDPVGPILDDFYGVALDITFNTIQSLEYEPNNWID